MTIIDEETTGTGCCLVYRIIVSGGTDLSTSDGPLNWQLTADTEQAVEISDQSGCDPNVVAKNIKRGTVVWFQKFRRHSRDVELVRTAGHWQTRTAAYRKRVVRSMAHSQLVVINEGRDPNAGTRSYV